MAKLKRKRIVPVEDRIRAKKDELARIIAKERSISIYKAKALISMNIEVAMLDHGVTCLQ